MRALNVLGKQRTESRRCNLLHQPNTHGVLLWIGVMGALRDSFCQVHAQMARESFALARPLFSIKRDACFE